MISHKATGGHLVHGRRSLAETGRTVIDRAAAAGGEPATLRGEDGG